MIDRQTTGGFDLRDTMPFVTTWMRIADEHNFHLLEPETGRCRMQVLTALAHAPMLVATQIGSGWNEGSSITNAAESFAAQALSRYLPAVETPPSLVLVYVSSPDDLTWSERPGTVVEFVQRVRPSTWCNSAVA